jgi:hypothetical protein
MGKVFQKPDLPTPCNRMLQSTIMNFTLFNQCCRLSADNLSAGPLFSISLYQQTESKFHSVHFSLWEQVKVTGDQIQ